MSLKEIQAYLKEKKNIAVKMKTQVLEGKIGDEVVIL